MSKLLYSVAAIICLLNGISSSPYKDVFQIRQNSEVGDAERAQTNIFPIPPYCGIANSPDSRIYRGIKAERNEFPWLVYLIMGCGGSFINSRWILTAAHCFFDENHQRVFSTKVYVNALHCVVNVGCDYNSIELRSKNIIVHEQFYYGQYYNDIALVEVEYNNEILPICLPINGEAFGSNLDYRAATVVGWGKTEEQEMNNILNVQLFKTQLYIWPAQQCEAYTIFFIKSELQICAKGKRGSSACEGDSGSPLMLQFQAPYENDSNKPFYQVGIVSFSKKPCAMEGHPDIFTNVRTYIPWIERTILNNQ